VRESDDHAALSAMAAPQEQINWRNNDKTFGDK